MKKKHPRVMVPLNETAKALQAMQQPQAFVWVWLLYRAWKVRNRTFPLPSGQLLEYGVDRRAKRRALNNLEKAGLIVIERRSRKTLIVTVIGMDPRGKFPTGMDQYGT